MVKQTQEKDSVDQGTTCRLAAELSGEWQNDLPVVSSWVSLLSQFTAPWPNTRASQPRAHDLSMKRPSWCVSLNHPFSLTGVHVGSLHRNGAEKLYIPKIFWLRFLWINPLFTPHFSTNSSNNIITQTSPHTEPTWKRANDVNKTLLWQYFFRIWSAVPLVSHTSCRGWIFMLIWVRPFSQSSFIPPSLPFSTFWALAKGCAFLKAQSSCLISAHTAESTV